MKLSPILAVEIATKENSNVLFGPTQTKLRGRWAGSSPSLRGMTSDVGMNQMPDLPGLHLILDTNEKTFTIHDPLSDPDYADTVESANAVLKSVFGTQSKPAADEVKDVSDDTEFKTSLYWIRRLVDAEQCRVISGTIPSIEEIRSGVKGKIRKSYWNSNPQDVWEEDESVDTSPKPAKKTSAKTEA
jgi:hypothetical protein